MSNVSIVNQISPVDGPDEEYVSENLQFPSAPSHVYHLTEFGDCVDEEHCIYDLPYATML
uniref:Uncharacterized protein n=1 Tax=viral metagenome TaxID=1070528 RepID=A0A6C0BKD2_9ZZZZ